MIAWLITQESPVQATVLFQASTPAPFLDAIYYGTQDVWQVFDHNLPVVVKSKLIRVESRHDNNDSDLRMYSVWES